MIRFLLTISLLPLLLLLVGCAKKSADYNTSYYADDYGGGEYYEMDGAAAGSSGSGRGYRAESARMPMSAPAPMMDDGFADADMDMEGEAEPPPPEGVSEPAQETEQARMVYYNGYLHLRAVRAEETTQAVAELAREAGGYVEQLSSQRVVVRVPVASFEDVFEAALGLGELLDRNVSAQDVTEAFTDVSLRLKTLKSTRDRLVELLAKAKDEQEKLALLREIRRVSEEIDVVEGKLRTLAELASFSRLTVQVSPRADFANRANRSDAEGLGWIQSLSPFSRSVGAYSKRVPLVVPEGMVMLAPRGRFVAESADGAVMWTSRLENAPRGSADFWSASVAERLGAEFETGEPEVVGGFVMLRMVEQGEADGYRYLIGVRDAGKWLEVVQVYYPSAEQEERYGDSVRAAIAGGQS